MPGAVVGNARYAWKAKRTCAPSRGTSACALDGGFSNYVLVDHPRFLVDYEPLSAPFAATLGCSGLTAFSALKKAAPVDAQRPLMIVGAGGLGLAAVSLCLALYQTGPIVADVDAAKRRAALEAGASAVVDPADPDDNKRVAR